MEQRELIERLKKNPAALQALMHSPDGQELLRLLQGDDGGRTLSQAAMQAAGGSTQEMARLLGQVMASPQGAALVQRISDAVRRQY